MTCIPAAVKIPISSHTIVSAMAPPNPFSILSSFETILDEGEIQLLDVQDLVSDENISLKQQASPSFLSPSLVGDPLSPLKDVNSPPSYADIARKKHRVRYGSS